MKITINVESQLAVISGGDGGPGTGDSIGQGNLYKWSLPIANIVSAKDQQTLVTNTLSVAMEIIGGVAMMAVQSTSIDGAGDYDGVHFSLGGSSELTVGQGQLQAIGSEIDISAVNQYEPSFASLSSLPKGFYQAAPVSGVTTYPLHVLIE